MKSKHSPRDQLLPLNEDFEARYGSFENDYLGSNQSVQLNELNAQPHQPQPLKKMQSIDEFGEESVNALLANKITRTGRQRKKLAARTKGSEFQAKRKKRRVYFSCISSEVDLESLHDAVRSRITTESACEKWEVNMYDDVVHIFIPGNEEIVESSNSVAFLQSESENAVGRNDSDGLFQPILRLSSVESPADRQLASRLWTSGGRELFIFEFGAAVFWGYARGEEDEMIEFIRNFVEQGLLDKEEFLEGQDDMAFVTSAEDDQIAIANDVITLPDDTSAKSRLAVSFAIAQSSILNVFEMRVEQRVKDYKYIPETLADSGKVRLSPKKLGRMIGEVYRIRHDVNLHTEILDTPDFFWKENSLETVYWLTSRYLEMSGRTEILNKRLDMLRELLQVLVAQQENESAVKLEWIVIWLIVISVVVESTAIAVQILKH